MDMKIIFWGSGIKQMISVIMSSFMRSKLLDLGLSSIVKHIPELPFEVIVVNDGVEDDTESVCKKYNNFFDVKYFFCGHRNINGIIPQGPALPNNIGIKNSSGDIIVLTCPEIYHLDNCLQDIVSPLINEYKRIVIPNSMYFDDTGAYTNAVMAGVVGNLSSCNVRTDSVQMPFLMGIWKKELLDVGGYDEDFTGYASEDNDLLNRLMRNGCVYHRVNTGIIHLYHGPRCPDGLMWDNQRWAFNRKLYNERMGQVVRNVGKDWGTIKK